jgi:hypothetical protein
LESEVTMVLHASALSGAGLLPSNGTRVHPFRTGAQFPFGNGTTNGMTRSACRLNRGKWVLHPCDSQPALAL